jgi:hypothetical protein
MCNPSIGGYEREKKSLLVGEAWAQSRTPCPADLSFVHRYTGESGRDYISHWNVTHSPDDQWNEYVELGASFFAELEALAACDEAAAHDAMRMAVTSATWSTEGWGEEGGFAWQMASAAIVGMRAIRAGWLRYLPAD